MEQHDAGDAACGYVAEHQHGLITLKQAEACGCGLTAVRGRVKRGAWRSMQRGVYLVGAQRPTDEARILAAALATGPDAVTSHTTAAWLHGMLVRLERPLHLTVQGSRNPRRLDGVTAHRVGDSCEPHWRRGIPVTPPADTLIDLAGVLDARRLEAAVAEALSRNVLTRASLIAAVQNAGRRKGIGTLRQIVTDGARRTRSDYERTFLALMRDAELPEPQTNVVVEDKEVDAWWPDAKLAVEIDPFSTHGGAAQFEDDHLLDADFEAAGAKVLRFTGKRLRTRPTAVAVRVGAVLALRLGGLPVKRRRR